MRTAQQWLDDYGQSHQNSTNKLIHWICVPAIMFSIFGFLLCIPFPFVAKSLFANWAMVALVLVLAFYLRLSFSLFVGFILIGAAMLYGNYALYEYFNYSVKSLAILSTTIFVVAWIFQFIGHKIEGEKPSFFEDLQFLLIGPMWLLHFIYKKIGISY